MSARESNDASSIEMLLARAIYDEFLLNDTRAFIGSFEDEDVIPIDGNFDLRAIARGVLGRLRLRDLGE